MSGFVLSHLSQLVANGAKTSSGFKQVHLNSCARALYENLGVQRTASQIGNHLRKWKKVYAKIEKLKNMSAAVWDEDTCTIRLAPEHYKEYIKASILFYAFLKFIAYTMVELDHFPAAHRMDADYLNTPLEHYREMATIFDNSLTSGAYAKGANDPLALEVAETDYTPRGTSYGIGAAGKNGGQTASGKPPPAKKHKVAADDALLVMMTQTLGELTSAIKQMARADTDVPEGLYNEIMSIRGFEKAHLDDYYAYLCEKPSQARAFYALPLSSKLVWIARYIKNHLSDVQ
ncbi:hypothetical protein U9M48_014180 [Paspalum notatum var. saurae]|uniref:Myb/SANT-like domain-containing protein n=1 Tax=Paspalum notatum var. saurae TaxID=547442 RepID=A0AAQ3WK87_PASNO